MAAAATASTASIAGSRNATLCTMRMYMFRPVVVSSTSVHTLLQLLLAVQTTLMCAHMYSLALHNTVFLCMPNNNNKQCSRWALGLQ
jgi:hypothetical protein